MSTFLNGKFLYNQETISVMLYSQSDADILVDNTKVKIVKAMKGTEEP